jgi:hypothetical protein
VRDTGVCRGMVPEDISEYEQCGKDVGECTSHYTGNGIYEVECSYGTFVVDLTHRTCGYK